MYRTHTCGELSKKQAGKKVVLAGWVHKHRKMGSLIFVDLRDRYGITQVVFDPDRCKNFAKAKKLKYEYVLKVNGIVKKRDKKDVNEKITTGEIELQVDRLQVLSKSEVLPFEIFDTEKGPEDEELRLKYRYLELRREKLKNNILFRGQVVSYIRKYMQENGFIDISTPILTVSSPEGARDYLVPSRLHAGKFYALPQAPQQYKQLLMIAGFDRYYQIAPCMRDEDARADRSPGEFYQLDCEVSFMEQDQFFALMEPLFVRLTEKVAGKKVWKKPFPRFTYKQAMEKYGSDRPDLRFGIELEDVSGWAVGTDFKIFKTSEYARALKVPGGAVFTRKQIDQEFTAQAMRQGVDGLAWMKYENDFEGGITKFFTAKQLRALRKKMKIKKGDILFFAAGEWAESCLALGAVRTLAAQKMGLADPDTIAWAWVVDFPMYERDRESGKIIFSHNPFSMPQGGSRALEEMDPLDILGYQYDIVANGLELSSGAVRNTDPKLMYRAFEIAGYSKKQVDEQFAHMIEAFNHGAPPHCGFAPGIERLLMLLLGEKNIRAVTAFPKNQQAEEPMTGSPSKVDKNRLKELHVKVLDEKKD